MKDPKLTDDELKGEILSYYQSGNEAGRLLQGYVRVIFGELPPKDTRFQNLG
jgi:hypothetical protein